MSTVLTTALGNGSCSVGRMNASTEDRWFEREDAVDCRNFFWHAQMVRDVAWSVGKSSRFHVPFLYVVFTMRTLGEPKLSESLSIICSSVSRHPKIFQFRVSSHTASHTQSAYKHTASKPPFTASKPPRILKRRMRSHLPFLSDCGIAMLWWFRCLSWLYFTRNGCTVPGPCSGARATPE